MAVSVSMLSRAAARSVDLVLVLAMAEALPVAGWLGGMLYLLVSDGVRGGQSLGKQLMGLRVVGRDGADCSLEESMTRNLDLALALMLWKLPVVGWLILAVAVAAEGVIVIGSAEGVRFGDELARTRVVPAGYSGEAAATAKQQSSHESSGVQSGDAHSQTQDVPDTAGADDSAENIINKEESVN